MGPAARARGALTAVRKHALWLLLVCAVVLPARVGLTPTVASARVPVPAVAGATMVWTHDSYQGRPRGYLLHVPVGLSVPAPLVLVLHGLRQDPQRIRDFSDTDRIADRNGFVVAYPGGAAGSWNAGFCCGDAAAQGVDDLAFLDHVIAGIRARTLVDPARIYLEGYSNGGMMALRYACERPTVVAAVAVVAGSVTAGCSPAAPVAALDLHGGRDTVVPVRGGVSHTLRIAFGPVRDGLSGFAARGGDVEVEVLPRASHRWMTRAEDGLDAGESLWDWLRDHPRPL